MLVMKAGSPKRGKDCKWENLEYKKQWAWARDLQHDASVYKQGKCWVRTVVTRKYRQTGTRPTAPFMQVLSNRWAKQRAGDKIPGKLVRGDRFGSVISSDQIRPDQADRQIAVIRPEIRNRACHRTSMDYTCEWILCCCCIFSIAGMWMSYCLNSHAQ
jgi:hypothetical protein